MTGVVAFGTLPELVRHPHTDPNPRRHMPDPDDPRPDPLQLRFRDEVTVLYTSYPFANGFRVRVPDHSRIARARRIELRLDRGGQAWAYEYHIGDRQLEDAKNRADLIQDIVGVMMLTILHAVQHALPAPA